ncbi:hypothetical protein [Kitasatospora sp. GAS1066B]
MSNLLTLMYGLLALGAVAAAVPARRAAALSPLEAAASGPRPRG